MKKHSLPDWATVHKELRNQCVTLQLLWEEYGEHHPGGFYSYNHYCRLYRDWLKTTSPSMRQVHKAAEKLFVDYCGPTVDITHPDTEEIRTVQIFVAVLGASSYTWVEATWSQQLEDWIMSHVLCFQWLGGVPELVVPDNLKSATSRACKYDPDVNPTYQQMLEHYNVAVMPARPRKPKDQSKAEVGVQVVERWIMARIRHETFYSLASLNQRIRELLERLNNKVMKKMGYSRAKLFIQIDKPALNPLPTARYSYTLVKKVRVHADYHVEIDKHDYSVPCSLLGIQREAWLSGELARLFNQGQEVATHPRRRHYGYTRVKNICRKLIVSTPHGHQNVSLNGRVALAVKPMTMSPSHPELPASSGAKLPLLPGTPEPAQEIQQSQTQCGMRQGTEKPGRTTRCISGTGVRGTSVVTGFRRTELPRKQKG